MLKLTVKKTPKNLCVRKIRCNFATEIIGFVLKIAKVKH